MALHAACGAGRYYVSMNIRFNKVDSGYIYAKVLINRNLAGRARLTALMSNQVREQHYTVDSSESMTARLTMNATLGHLHTPLPQSFAQNTEQRSANNRSPSFADCCSALCERDCEREVCSAQAWR